MPGFINLACFDMNYLKSSKHSIFLLPILLISAVVALLTSCDANNIHKPDVTYSYTFQKNAAIKIDTVNVSAGQHDITTALHFSILNGQNLVFSYKKHHSSSKEVADASSSKVLVFQVQADTTRFSYHNNGIQQIHAFYQQDCYCPGGGDAVKVTQGIISGERLNPVTWIIRVDVTIDYFGNTVHLKFHQPFYDKKVL
jgi:hypothetical protein